MSKDENIVNDFELTDEMLLEYLKGNLSEAESHDIEKKISESDSDFISESIDGLQDFSDKNKIEDYVHALNKNLRKQLKIKKRRELKRKINSIEWILLAAAVIIALCFITYIVLRMIWKI